MFAHSLFHLETKPIVISYISQGKNAQQCEALTDHIRSTLPRQFPTATQTGCDTADVRPNFFFHCQDRPKGQEHYVITASSASSDHPVDNKNPKTTQRALWCGSWYSHCLDNHCLCSHSQRIPFLTQLFVLSYHGSTSKHRNYDDLILWWGQTRI